MVAEADRSVLQVVLAAPRPVRVLVIGVFINRLGSFFLTFLVLFLTQLGFTLQQLSLILLVVGAATPIGSLLGGWAADRFSRRASLVGSTLLAAASFLVVGLADDRAVVLVAVGVASLFAQAYLPAASALLVDSTREQDRVPTFALFRLAINVGAALGPLLAAVVARHGLDLLFVVNSGAYVLFALVLAIGLPRAGRTGLPADTPMPVVPGDPGTVAEPVPPSNRSGRSTRAGGPAPRRCGCWRSTSPCWPSRWSTSSTPRRCRCRSPTRTAPARTRRCSPSTACW